MRVKCLIRNYPSSSFKVDRPTLYRKFLRISDIRELWAATRILSRGSMSVSSSFFYLHLPILIISCNIRPVSQVHQEVGGYAVCFSGDGVFLCGVGEGFFPDKHSVFSDGGVHGVTVRIDGEGEKGTGFVVEIHGGVGGEVHISVTGCRKIHLSCFHG